jgi:methyltransferase
MTPLYWIVLAVGAQRLAELALSRRNERRLIALGGIERGAGHYPVLAALHAAWLVSMPLALPADSQVDWRLIGLFAALQLGRYWVIASLGVHWTTRIITIPGSALVRRGPYRFLRHPNYLIVAAEIAVLPLAFGAWTLALVFSLLNAVVLAHRIRVENAALAAHCVNVPNASR